MTDLNDLRKEYTLGHLENEDINKDPLKQFQIWFEEAVDFGVKEPNSMTLATANSKGIVSARTMLLKYFDDNGFVFFTNYNSNKAKDLDSNSNAALLFWWPECERQIEIEGSTTRLDDKHNQEYFASRPLESRAAAVLSKQSSVLQDKSSFIEEFQKLLSQHKKNQDIPCPKNWGGYVLHPAKIEFWQGGEHRIHDRLCYTRENDEWKVQRLFP